MRRVEAPRTTKGAPDLIPNVLRFPSPHGGFLWNHCSYLLLPLLLWIQHHLPGPLNHFPLVIITRVQRDCTALALRCIGCGQITCGVWSLPLLPLLPLLVVGLLNSVIPILLWIKHELIRSSGAEATMSARVGGIRNA